MTLEQALGHSGPLVATWRDRDAELARVSVFSVGADGARVVGEIDLDRRTRHTTFNTIRAAGARVGANAAPFVWVADDEGLTIWSTSEAVVNGDRAVVSSQGSVVPATTITSVVSFGGDAASGVRLETTAGPRILLDAKHPDRTWSREIGRDLANWLELPYRDVLSSETNSEDLRVAACARTLADRVEGLPSTGGFEKVVEELGSIGTTPVVLSYVQNPLESDKRFVEIRAFTETRISSSARMLAHGTNQQVATYLRSVHVGPEVIASADELRRGLEEEGYR